MTISTIIIAIAMLQMFTPTSRATALILFDPQREAHLDLSDRRVPGVSDISARVDSEVEILRSDAVLLEVVHAAKLVDDPEYGASRSLRNRLAEFLGLAQREMSQQIAVGRALQVLRSKTSVERRGRTHVISIKVREKSAEQAAKLANFLAESYVIRQIQAKTDEIFSAKQAISQEIAPARRRAVDAERQANDYLVENIDEIISRNGRSDLQALRDDYQKLLTARLAPLARNEWNEIAQHIRTGERTDAGSALREARRKLVSALEVRDLSPDLLAGLQEVQQRAVSASAHYKRLLDREQELTSQASLQEASSVIVSKAVPPVSTDFPDKVLLIAAAGLVGLAVAIGVAFALEMFGGGVASAGQMEAVLGRPLAARIPAQRTGRAAHVADLPVAAPLSPYAESIRHLRLAIHSATHFKPTHERRADQLGTVILVASATSGEGRTSVALSLARTYALSGQRVLILDCDLRKPGVNQLLGTTSPTGLVDVLSGAVAERDLSRFLVKDAKTMLTAIGGELPASVPTDQLIAGSSLQQIIAAAQASFDCIIIDTPPVGTAVDGFYLAGQADAVVFVVQSTKSPRRLTHAALQGMQALTRAGTETLVVLNRA
jgi:succinoglycan biosynthesis transport protein ExoP